MKGGRDIVLSLSFSAEDSVSGSPESTKAFQVALMGETYRLALLWVPICARHCLAW